MDVFSIARASLRRWYILVPLVLLAAVFAVVQGKNVKPTYTVSSSVIIVAPNVTVQRTSGDSPSPANPLGSPNTAQIALVQRLNSAESATLIAQTNGATGSFQAGASKQAAIITLIATASTGTGANQTLAAAASAVPRLLSTLQGDLGASPRTYFRTVALTGNQGLTVEYAHRSRNIVLVALAGVLIAIIVSQLVDVAMLRRRRRRDDSDDRHRRLNPGDGLDPGPRNDHTDKSPGLLDELDPQQADGAGDTPVMRAH